MPYRVPLYSLTAFAFFSSAPIAARRGKRAGKAPKAAAAHA